MITALKVTYSQEADCCDGSGMDDQFIEIEMHDGGGGAFWTIKTERWALSDAAETKELAKKLKTLQKFVNASRKAKVVTT